VLREENVASAIVGASRPAQIRENEATAEIDLDADTLAQIESVPETTAPR
jgi:aryl-alcohol dehydrogenase-like predicted oxidoreductase